MGYSGRYHAASLAAVFVALAIGILVGIGLADDVVSGASQELENSLREDRDEAQDEAAAALAQLDGERAFGDLAAPALVDGRLARRRVGLFALGDEPDPDTADDAQSALGDAGAELASVATIALPPDLAALQEAAGGRFAAGRGGTSGAQLGAVIGRQLIGGGPLIERVRDELFVRFTGSLAGVDRAVLMSRPPAELQADLTGEERAFTGALLRAIDARAAGAVGVERSDTDPTTLGTFSATGIATVDDVDRSSGRVSLVYALLGAEGDFGRKEAATALLPDLLAPTPGP